jgi:hypothetical protein
MPINSLKTFSRATSGILGIEKQLRGNEWERKDRNGEKEGLN